jgi:hypothetical protein
LSALNHFTVPTVMYLSLPPSMVLEVSIYADANAGGKGQARPAGLRSKT